ncbi:hypothetical protein [Methylomonas sp. HYX-M1]|uniref:hypothetical protein n=1 Tax=Methylomonas sp. HYX-M1 TaxID=3139307 RepID=UPI00345BE09B
MAAPPARLVMNLVLLQHGYPIAIIHGDAESQLAYYDALEQCNLAQDKQPFHDSIAEKVIEALQRRLTLLQPDRPE